MASDHDLLYRIDECSAAIAVGPAGFEGRFLEGPASGAFASAASLKAVVLELRQVLAAAKEAAAAGECSHV